MTFECGEPKNNQYGESYSACPRNSFEVTKYSIGNMRFKSGIFVGFGLLFNLSLLSNGLIWPQ